ncbi:putative oxidoreductase [Escherichia coli]|nr:putative oxidoreductase [Escherichia coli]
MVINCAFIGFGKSTTRYHLPYVLNRKDSWHVAHIFRRHAKPEEQAPIYSHIHFTSDLDEVLNDPDVKLVVVCTHADSHFEYAKRALEAGKNVLVEKTVHSDTCAGERAVCVGEKQRADRHAVSESSL